MRKQKKPKFFVETAVMLHDGTLLQHPTNVAEFANETQETRCLLIKIYQREHRNGDGAVKGRLRIDVIVRDHGVCRYCSSKPVPPRLDIDHVVPLSQGGLTVQENLVVACETCNARKRGRTPEEAGMELRAL